MTVKRAAVGTRSIRCSSRVSARVIQSHELHSATVTSMGRVRGGATVKRDLATRCGFAAAILVGWIAVTLAGTSAAMADPNCNEFFSNSDGSWSPSHPIVIGGPTSQTQIGPSDRFRTGDPGLGGRIARSLNAHCRQGAAAVRPLGIPRTP